MKTAAALVVAAMFSGAALADGWGVSVNIGGGGYYAPSCSSYAYPAPVVYRYPVVRSYPVYYTAPRVVYRSHSYYRPYRTIYRSYR